ncbi:hypothetical protein BDP27DRAFT_1429564 [Rhodocollybia butyracea]|uniref:Uncharacterized protein n=1 Tax=Rhodocollybia butyracea TaxID=206335 RepID=A0A9P5U0T7_9AGAR|nr:hypothetical protein BDP27DRAFT_1429564 [Rhodocollybia butyracea]
MFGVPIAVVVGFKKEEGGSPDHNSSLPPRVRDGDIIIIVVVGVLHTGRTVNGDLKMGAGVRHTLPNFHNLGIWSWSQKEYPRLTDKSAIRVFSTTGDNSNNFGKIPSKALQPSIDLIRVAWKKLFLRDPRFADAASKALDEFQKSMKNSTKAAEVLTRVKNYLEYFSDHGIQVVFRSESQILGDYNLSWKWDDNFELAPAMELVQLASNNLPSPSMPGEFYQFLLILMFLLESTYVIRKYAFPNARIYPAIHDILVEDDIAFEMEYLGGYLVFEWKQDNRDQKIQNVTKIFIRDPKAGLDYEITLDCVQQFMQGVYSGRPINFIELLREGPSSPTTSTRSFPPVSRRRRIHFLEPPREPGLAPNQRSISGCCNSNDGWYIPVYLHERARRQVD